ncbi:retinol dehydrogenase [Colletotrichum graminicola]|nr:retinol dehydrogenase [Colletotrichum graminicola]
MLIKIKKTHIYLAARNEAKALAAIEDIKKAVPKAAPITFLEIDLTSFESIKRAANEFRSKSETLHILVNNAGIMAWPPSTTKEGYEIQFGTNHMGHALLTKLLLPTLQHTAQTSPDKDVRIVSLSSVGENWVPSDLYNFDDLKTDMASTGTWARYGASKVANIHHSRALAKRYPEIRCISVHPGSVNTNLTSGLEASWPLIKPILGIFAPLVLSSVADGAKNQIWASVSPDAESGVFYWPVGVKGRDSKHAKNEELSEKLWEWTEKELEAYT